MTHFRWRTFLFWLLLVLGSIAAGIILARLLMAEVRNTLEDWRTPPLISLDAALLPTAQFLYEHPEQLPFNVKVEVSNTYDVFSGGEKEICVLFQATPEYRYASHDFYIDKTLTGYVYTGKSKLNRDQGWNVGMCLLPVSSLDKGLHLLEIHLTRAFGDAPKIYRLAVMVE